MKLLKTDELDENELDKLYSFLMQSGNFINKFNINNIIWSIIYLRKIFNKSYKSKKNNKERVKYNYIITNSDEIICFFTLHYIKKDNNISIADLTLILKNKEHLEKIFNIIQTEFQELSSIMSNINLLSIYIPNKELVLVQNISNNIDFELGFLDNITYKEECNVYYNLYINDNLVSDKQHDKYHDKYHAYSKGQIIELLMNQYGVNTIVNPVKDISRKLTRKSIELPELKVITKNIFDIKEIQDLPEYDYDYNKVYSYRNYSFISYLINTKQPNIDEFIMNRYFKGSIKFNQNIYNLLKNIYTFINENINMQKFNDTLFNIDYLLKINNTFIYTINNLYYDKFIKKNNSNLILCNTLDTIKYFSSFKIDMIRTKSNVNYKESIQEVKKLNNNIIITNSNNELKNAMLKNNKKYSFILIENYYPNYDYLINNSLICKISTIVYSILNSLKYINKDGSILLSIYLNSLDIPIVHKTFNFILSLFENFNIEILVQNRNYLLLKKFKGLNQYNEKIINTLLNIFNKFEKEELSTNDIYNLILSNKFTYKINNPNNINKNNIQKKIIYNIEGFPSNITNKLKEIQTYINNYYNKIKQIEIDYLETDNKNIENSYIKTIKKKYIKLLEFIDRNNLLVDENIPNIIKLLRK
jgi:hypothetical protein